MGLGCLQTGVALWGVRLATTVVSRFPVNPPHPPPPPPPPPAARPRPRPAPPPAPDPPCTCPCTRPTTRMRHGFGGSARRDYAMSWSTAKRRPAPRRAARRRLRDSRGGADADETAARRRGGTARGERSRRSEGEAVEMRARWRRALLLRGGVCRRWRGKWRRR